MWAGTISHNDLTGLGRSVFMAVHQMEHELSGMDEKLLTAQDFRFMGILGKICI